MMLFWCFYSSLGTYFTPFCSFSIVEFQQANISWDDCCVVIYFVNIFFPFQPNAYVFPGGVIASCDFSNDWKSVVNNQNEKKLQKTLRPFLYTENDDKGLLPEVAFRLCALRETFEESGILLVTDSDGQNKVLSDPNLHVGGKYDTLKSWRDKVNDEPKYFLDLFR